MQMQAMAVGNDLMMYLLREDGVIEEWLRTAQGTWVHNQNVREPNEQGTPGSTPVYRNRGSDLGGLGRDS